MEVGNGYTPAECMQRFLNIAVEDTLADLEQEKDTRVGESSAPSETSTEPPSVSTSGALAGAGGGEIPGIPGSGTTQGASAAASSSLQGPDLGAAPPPSTTDDAAARGMSGSGDAAPASDGITSQRVSPHTPVGVGPGSAGRSFGQAAVGSTGVNRRTGNGGGGIGARASLRATSGHNHGSSRRPGHLGPESPALMLASALVSSVHPKVLEAAMSAATAAADELSRESADMWFASRSHKSTFLARRSPGSTSCVSSQPAGLVDEKVESTVQQPQPHYGRPPVANGRAEGDSLANMGGAAHAKGREGGEWAGVDDDAKPVDMERRAARFGAARAAVLSAAGLQARGLAELEERRTEALLADLLEAR